MPIVALAQNPSHQHVPFAVDQAGQLLVSPPAAVYNGQKTVASAGTAEPLAASQALVSGVYIKALATNTDAVYVGDSDVDAAGGFVLAPGELVFLEIADLASVYIDAAEDAEGVSYIGS